jgi:hypothetical protein
MRETEVRAINRLHRSPDAVVQVMIRPRFSTAMLELHPLRILNPGPNGGQSAFLFRGEWSVAVRGCPATSFASSTAGGASVSSPMRFA